MKQKITQNIPVHNIMSVPDGNRTDDCILKNKYPMNFKLYCKLQFQEVNMVFNKSISKLCNETIRINRYEF